MNKRSLFIFGSLFLSSIILVALITKQSTPTAVEEAVVKPPTPIQEPIPIPTKHIDTHTVQKGEFLGSILPQYNIPTNEVLESSKAIFDLSKIRAGKTFSFVKDTIEAEEYTEIRYPIDQDNTLVVTKEQGVWSAQKETLVYQKKREQKQFSISQSFWQSASDAGLQDADIASLVQVFEYDIDFNTEIRENGSVRLAVDGLYLNDNFVRFDSPDIVEFTNNDEKFVAIRYTTKDNETLYYDEKGVSRKGAFLRSPLAFSRVTSSFNPKRFHPILKKKVAHNGTDFGAPTGTPIRAAANGIVTYAGSNGGHGKFIKIKHSSGYETSYSHLSKISVSKGSSVKQGAIIGQVGSTGRSTGPHLHYQMWKNGRFVDAMKEKLPKTQSIPASEKDAFVSHQKKLFTELQ